MGEGWDAPPNRGQRPRDLHRSGRVRNRARNTLPIGLRGNTVVYERLTFPVARARYQSMRTYV